VPGQDAIRQENTGQAGAQTGSPYAAVTNPVHFNLPLRNLARFVQVYHFNRLADTHFHD
jgi:hypothetical protein